MCGMKIETMIQLISIIIGFVNIFALFRIAKVSNKLLDNENKKNRSNYLLKSLVLDYNLKNFYKLSDELENEYSRLIDKDVDKLDDIKKDIEVNSFKIFTRFSNEFYDIINAIDEELYTIIANEIEKLQDSLLINLFDNGVNLNHRNKYNELILNPILIVKNL